MEYKNDFRYDLKVGHKGERYLAAVLEGSTIEVKTDSWIAKTKRVAVEFESRGKPSGIATTEADYWCFIFNSSDTKKSFIMVDTDKLKDISRRYWEMGSIKNMGDNNTSRAVMIPLCEFVFTL
jgi:hypothetical protein